MSSDPVVVQKYIDDPLVYSGKWYARTGSELVKQMKIVMQKASQFNYPLFMAHGEKDGLTEPEGTKLFYSKVKSSIKEMHIIPDAFHELVNEPSKAKVMITMRDWMYMNLDKN